MSEGPSGPRPESPSAERALTTQAQHELFGLLRRTFAIAFLSLLALTATVAITFIAQSRADQYVRRSNRVVRFTRESFSLAVDRQNAVRGFLLSGDTSYLSPETAGRDRMRWMLDSLQLLAEQGAAVEGVRARAFLSSVHDWENNFVAPVLRASSPAEAREAGSVSHFGRDYFNAVRRTHDELLRAEDYLYLTQAVHKVRVVKYLLTAVPFEILLLMVVLLLLGGRILRLATLLDLQAQRLVSQDEALRRRWPRKSRVRGDGGDDWDRAD